MALHPHLQQSKAAVVKKMCGPVTETKVFGGITVAIAMLSGTLVAFAYRDLLEFPGLLILNVICISLVGISGIGAFVYAEIARNGRLKTPILISLAIFATPLAFIIKEVAAMAFLAGGQSAYNPISCVIELALFSWAAFLGMRWYFVLPKPNPKP